MKIQPLRVSVTGIDGAGKSTTAKKVIDRIGNNHTVVMPGRPTYAIDHGKKDYFYPYPTKAFDRLHHLADQTGLAKFVGTVNTLSMLFRTRIVEPAMNRFSKPDLIMADRDAYIDPAVYSIIYASTLSKRPMDRRIDLINLLTRAKYPDLIFFLTVPPDLAVERIEKRMADEAAKAAINEKKKWRHLHEDPTTLAKLQQEYLPAVAEVRRRNPNTEVVQINTEKVNHADVVEIIFDSVQRHLANRNVQTPGWTTIG